MAEPEVISDPERESLIHEIPDKIHAAEVISDPERESLIHEIPDKIHAADDSTSSSVPDYEEKRPAPPFYVKPKVYRLFGREKPVHKVFGGGKSADLMLWKNKNISAAVLGGATAIWVFFELLEYHLLTLACHLSILALAMLFLWSNATILINKRAPHFPEVQLPEAPFHEVASALRSEINRALSMMREIASGRDLKKFLQVVFGLWILSIVGSFCNFVSLFYMLFVFLHTVPVLYENYEDKVDVFLEKAMVELKKQYALFDSKVLSKIPGGPIKEKKRA